jgi:selT/selW/selH-like putative selenoprotein
LAEELKKAFNAEVELATGSKGIFDVVVDGKMVFSRFIAGRFPEPGEVVKLLS